MTTQLTTQSTTQSLAERAQPAHLTDALRRSGALPEGHVRDVMVESSRATLLSATPCSPGGAPNWSSSDRLRARRVNSAPGGCLLQSSGRRDARASSALLRGIWDAERGTSSRITITPEMAAPPTWTMRGIGRARSSGMVDDPRLGRSGLLRRVITTERLAAISRLRGSPGDGLSPERRALYARVLDAVPRLLLRYTSHRNVTIVQASARVELLPVARPRSRDVACSTGHGASTPARTTCLHDARTGIPSAAGGSSSRCSTLSRDLAHGVRGYDRRALADDYRQSVLWQITIPVWQAAPPAAPIWGAI